MKKYIIIILFFQYCLFSEAKNLSSEVKSFNTIDSINLKNLREISIDKNSNQNIKFILAPQENSSDHLKYIIPIFTLILGIALNKLLDKYNNRQKTKKSGERWIAELRSLEQPIKEQIKRLEDLISGLDNSSFTIPILSSYSILNGESFKALDKNELLQYIEIRNKKLDFKEVVVISNRIHGYVNIISSLHQTMLDKYKEFNDQTSLYTNSLSKNLQSFNTAFANYGIEIEKEIKDNPINDPRYNPIASLFQQFIVPNIQSSNFNPYELAQHFFMPVILILANYRLDDKTKLLTTPATACLNDIKALKLEKEYMLENSKKIILFFTKEINRLESLIQEI